MEKSCRFTHWHLSFVKFQNNYRVRIFWSLSPQKISRKSLYNFDADTKPSLKNKKNLTNQDFWVKNKHRNRDTVSYHNYGAFLVGMQHSPKVKQDLVCEAYIKDGNRTKKKTDVRRIKTNIFFGRNDRIWTCDIVLPNKTIPIFCVIFASFWCFLVRNRCFRVLLSPLFPRSPTL